MTRIPAVLALLLAATVATAPAATVTRITASGEGIVTMTPDMATVQATIQTNADRAADATSQNNAIYQRAADAAAKAGVARGDIAFARYELSYNPRPSPRPGEAAPSGRFGYVVVRSFNVKVRDTANVGTVVDALVGSGVNNIDNVTFGVSDSSRARSEAAGKAFALARSRAEDAARAAGLHITGIEEISTGAVPVFQPAVRTFALASAAVPTTIESTGVDVTANVNVVFLAQP